MRGEREGAVLRSIADLVEDWRVSSGYGGRRLPLADLQRRLGLSPSTISSALLRPEVAMSDRLVLAIEAKIPGTEGAYNRLLQARQEDLAAQVGGISAPPELPDILDAVEEIQVTLDALKELIRQKIQKA